MLIINSLGSGLAAGSLALARSRALGSMSSVDSRGGVEIDRSRTRNYHCNIPEVLGQNVLNAMRGNEVALC